MKERLDAETRAKQITEQMAEQLQLNEEQKTKILDINRGFVKKRDAEMEARRNEAMEREAKIVSILTEEQKLKWENLKIQRMDRKRPPEKLMREEIFQKDDEGIIKPFVLKK